MFKSFMLIALIGVASTVFAQEAGWYQVATSSDGQDVYSIKLGSGEHAQNKQGQAITVVVGQSQSKLTNVVNILKWYVTDADCAQGYGELVVLDIQGNVMATPAFAKGGQNIASGIASAVCAAHDTSNANSSKDLQS